MPGRNLIAACALLATAGSMPAHPPEAGFRFTDITRDAGINYRHNSGAYGKKYLPETLGPGAAFLDYNGDGWQDILFANSMDWPGHHKTRSTPRLYRNNRDGTFSDVTRASGLDVEMYGLGLAVGDYNNDGWPDIFFSCLGQSRLFQNNGKGGFNDVTFKSRLAGREGFSTSAMWLDYDRDGRLDLFVTNYVRWSRASDIFCSFDGKAKAYCTPEAYRGTTCWLFRNRGDGAFDDVTDQAGLLDTTSKSLGVALLDFDNDGWPDIFVANDTQPNKLYHNKYGSSFVEVAVKAGLAFSEDGRARAGMGADAADLDDSGLSTIIVTNFDNEMMGLYRGSRTGVFLDYAPQSGIGQATRRSLGFGCFFFDPDLDGRLDLLIVNGHIDETISSARSDVSYAQAPHLFMNTGSGRFREVTSSLGAAFATPRVARGAAYADFDRDGDLDLLLTTNNGPAVLYRNDANPAKNNFLNLRLKGTKSNRSALGATVRLDSPNGRQSQTVHSGSSYCSQSDLALTFGLGRDSQVNLEIEWPSGQRQKLANVKANQHLVIEESK